MSWIFIRVYLHFVDVRDPTPGLLLLQNWATVSDTKTLSKTWSIRQNLFPFSHFNFNNLNTSWLRTGHVPRCMSCMRLSPSHCSHASDAGSSDQCKDNTLAPAWPALYTNSKMSRSVISVLISIMCAHSYWSLVNTRVKINEIDTNRLAAFCTSSQCLPLTQDIWRYLLNLRMLSESGLIPEPCAPTQTL